MEFDERLQRTFESLAARLHQEIAAQLKAAGAELSASVQAERDAARADRDLAVAEATQAARADRDAAVAEAAQASRAAIERELTARHLEEVARAETRARAELTESHRAESERLTEGRRADSERLIETHRAESERLIKNHRAVGERLIEAIRALDGAKSLSEILDALVASASREVGRAAMFLLDGSTLNSWRTAGFDEFGTVHSPIHLPLADGGLIAEAAETGRLVQVTPGAARNGSLPAFVNLPEQSQALAVPLVMTGVVVGVLYVDEGNTEPMARESWPATVEVLARHAARSLEAITAARLAQVEEVVGS